jgi:type IV pilus assembly protein PilC
MPAYSYKARNYLGELVEGVVNARNPEELDQHMANLDLILIKAIQIKEEKKSTKKRIRRRDLILFSIHIATSLEAGVPIISALTDFAESTDNSVFKNILAGIVKQIESGQSFSQSLETYPRAFPEIYVSIIRAGEATGNLDKVLRELINFLEWQEELIAQVKQASIYPTFVFLMIGIVIFIMMTFTVPKFIPILKSFNVELPTPTKILISVANFFQHGWFIMLIIIGSIIAFYKITNKREKGKLFWDKGKLKLPIFGKLTLKLALSRFAHYTALLYSAGIGIPQTLIIVEKVVGNEVIAKEIKRTREEILTGSSMYESLKKSPYFPSLVLRMIQVGEETGSLDSTLKKVSDYYDKEVPQAIRKMFSVLEPTLIVFMGGIVLFIALSIFLPIYKLTSGIAAAGGLR